MIVERRQFLKSAAAVPLGFAGLDRLVTRPDRGAARPHLDGFGPLVPDARRMLDLPDGFSYEVVARAGQVMTDGFRVPGRQDGMAAFAGPEGLTILVCNHEVTSGSSGRWGAFGEHNELFADIDAGLVYDAGRAGAPCLGGTTTMVYDTRSQRLERAFLSLAGTVRNCAGGPTPWNSWLSCEETVERADGRLAKDHGYCFEVPVTAEPAIAPPIPLVAMGRFHREAVAVDPASGIVYQTEDRSDGLIYRYIPITRERLSGGGRLQALLVSGHPRLDTRNWRGRRVRPGQPYQVTWIDLDEVDSPDDDLRDRGFRQGAARFARGEGMWYGGDAVYFACTNGGPNQRGQIWRYTPSRFEGRPDEANEPGRLELFVEPNDRALVENADNLTISPWGDVILCEDGPGDQHLVGVTPSGRLYQLGRNAMNESDLAGATFSPDGSTLFVNIQSPGVTLAVTGPWPALHTL